MGRVLLFKFYLFHYMKSHHSNLRLIFRVIALVFFVVMWVSVFHSLETRKNLMLNNWQDLEMQVLKIEKDLVTRYDLKGLYNKKTTEEILDNIIRDHVKYYALLNTGKVVVFENNVLEYCQDIGDCPNKNIGKTIDELKQSREGIYLENFDKYVDLVKEKKEGRTWMISPITGGRVYLAVMPYEIRESIFVVAIMANESDILNYHGFYSVYFFSISLVSIASIILILAALFFDNLLKKLEFADIDLKKKNKEIEESMGLLEEKNKELEKTMNKLMDVNDQLGKFNRLAVERELTMMEMKKKMSKLKKNK